MLKKIKYSVKIVNGETLVFEQTDFQHSFAKGLTAITGPNGTGKSMVTEMAVYALFGSKALRGKAEDYKTLDVTLEAHINGKDVTVERVKGNASLKIGEQDIASGTVAVNKAVTDLFGYSLDVFNIANIAKQGEIEKLGSMKPAERKRLVDEVVGVNILDALEAYITNELKSAKAVVDALGPVLPLPEAPVLESVYDLETLENILAAVRAKATEKARLTAVANRTIAEKPVEPAAPEITESIEDLQTAEGERNRLIGQRDEIARQRAALNVSDTRPEAPVEPIEPTFLSQEAELTANLQKRADITGQLRAVQNQLIALENKRPTSITGLAAEDITAEWQKLDSFKTYEANVILRDRLRENKVPHDCPACNHHWEDADPRLAELEAMPVVEPAKYTATQLDDHERALKIDAEAAKLREEIDQTAASLELIGDPSTMLAGIQMYRRQHAEYQQAVTAFASYAKYDELTAAMSVIVVPDSVQSKIQALQLHRTAEANYQRDLSDWQQKYDEIEAARAELSAEKYAKDLDEEIRTFSAERDLHIQHEQLLKAYNADVERITTANGKITEAAEAVSQWKLSRESIRVVRAKVKGFLVPSLNKAASHLLSEMTRGQFSQINVTEEFEITIDGQRMETLSGGGKAVANLALRLALGQVLTNRVFSVVMLDEIDASCDDERAASMAAAVRELTDRDIIQQIVLISHKQGIDADHFVRMEEKS